MKLEVHLMQCISCFALRGGGTSSKIWFDDGQFKAKTGWFLLPLIKHVQLDFSRLWPTEALSLSLKSYLYFEGFLIPPKYFPGF